MINPIDKILTEWAYRVHDGMPNPSNSYHVVQLEQYLNELRLPRSVVKKVLEKVRRYKDNDYNKSVGRVGKPYGSEGEPSKTDKKGEEEPKKKKPLSPLALAQQQRKAKDKNWEGDNADQILDRVSSKDTPPPKKISKPEEAVNATTQHRKNLLLGLETAGKGGGDTTAQEEMANIGREIAADPEYETPPSLEVQIQERVCQYKTAEGQQSKYCLTGNNAPKEGSKRYKDVLKLYKVSSSGESTMTKVKNNLNYEYGKNQPPGYPTSTTDAVIVRDILYTKLKEAEAAGDTDAIEHYKEELYWFQKKATDKSVTGKEGDADTMMIYYDNDGRERILYNTNKQTENDQISNSTIETTKKSIIENVSKGANVKKVTQIAETQADEAKKYNETYTSGVRSVATDKTKRAELEKDKDIIAKAAIVDRGSQGRLRYVKLDADGKPQVNNKYAKEAKEAPEVRAKLLGLPDSPTPSVDKDGKLTAEYKEWRKEVNSKWKANGDTFTDEEAVMAAIDATGTGNLTGVGDGSTGAPYSIVKFADVTSDVRARVEKCMGGDKTKLKACSKAVATATDPNVKKGEVGTPLYGGIFTAEDVESIYNNQALKELEQSSDDRGTDLEGMYNETTEQLREEDQKYWDANPKEAAAAGYIKKDGKWVDNPKDDKAPENGPHERSYVAGFFERMHFNDYVSGDVDGRVMAEMGDNGYEPKDIRRCLAELTGLNTNNGQNIPSGADLQKHLLDNVRPTGHKQQLVYYNKKGEPNIIGTDTHRTAGRGEKMSGQYGTDLANCLKGLK